MRTRAPLLVAGAMVAALALGSQAQATVAGSQVAFAFSGGTFSGSGFFTVTTDPVSGDPANALAITGVTGTFSDSNPSSLLTGEAFHGVQALNPSAPRDPGSVLGVASFSYFHNVTYDNLFYTFPGSPIVCAGYPFSGGVLDTYGVLLTLANGDLVDLWSNGDPPAQSNFYGLDLLSSDGTVLDQSPIPPHAESPSGITVSVPEPSSLALFATAMLLVGLVWRRRPRSC